jgi:hypothetical protein
LEPPEPHGGAGFDVLLRNGTLAGWYAAHEPPLEPVIRRLLVEGPEIRAPRMTEILREDCGYSGSVE